MSLFQKLVLLGMVITASLCGGKEAQAQSPRFNPYNAANPYNRPTLSPYLNLLRRDASITENYFTLVRPQVQFNSMLNTQQQEISQLNRNVQALKSVTPGEQQAIRGTGHPAAFMNFSHFYPSAR